MKLLSQLLRERVSKLPSTVQFELETDDEIVKYEVHGTVEIERDPFGTGDSPTDYQYQLNYAINLDSPDKQKLSGEQFGKLITDAQYDWIADHSITSSQS